MTLLSTVSSAKGFGRAALNRAARYNLRNHGGTKALAKAAFATSAAARGPNTEDDQRLLVIGSGVAGSATALVAAEVYKIPVTMIFAGSMATDCNSFWAQGGIIYQNTCPAVRDSPEILVSDIHRAGAGLCYDPAVRKVAYEGPKRVQQLLLDEREERPYARVPFDTTPEGILALCREASHTNPRILHKADHTGKIITEHMVEAVARHPLIRTIPNTVVTDLVTVDDDICIGVQTLHRHTQQINVEYGTYGTVLCMGGLAGIYQHSTNPPGFNALGSSVALAERAHVTTQDLEFVQFHPTALYIPNESRFLLTEALRGEGAILRDADGRAFAREYHPDGELAPRDVVARAVFSESQKSADPRQHNAFLDITHRDAAWLDGRFPAIQAHLRERGLDLGRDRIPIVPAAHYTCGGIATNLQGQTSLKNLYAAGEAARTGLHGGNRLASTSLLEGLVFGASVAETVGSEIGASLQQEAMNVLSTTLANDRYGPAMANGTSAASSYQNGFRRRNPMIEPSTMEETSYHARELLRLIKQTLWDSVGVVRTPSGLRVAIEILEDITDQAQDLHSVCPTVETSAVRDAAIAGLSVAKAALANPKSIGAHCIMPDTGSDILNDSDEDDDDDATAAAASAKGSSDSESDEDEQEQLAAGAR